MLIFCFLLMLTHNRQHHQKEVYVMTVKCEMDADALRERLWSGGANTLHDLTNAEIETILRTLEDVFSDSMSLTDLNDFFWFERDTIAEWLGVRAYEDLMNCVL